MKLLSYMCWQSSISLKNIKKVNWTFLPLNMLCGPHNFYIILHEAKELIGFNSEIKRKYLYTILSQFIILCAYVLYLGFGIYINTK